jgi:hypothetical protein
MSSLDWFQIIAGFRYCLRRIIILLTSALACPQPKPLAVEAESAD